jgi:proline dehydrogenase
MLFRTLILRASGLRLVKTLVTRSFLFRPLVRRFIAGETLDTALAAADESAAQGFFVSLDLLGENVSSLAEAERERDAYLALIERIGRSPHRDRINVSIKLTAIGLDQGDDVAERHYRKILAAAAKLDMFVRADMEGSPYTERTIAMVERVFPDFPNTGTVLQSYLHRTPDDIERLIRLGCRVRIVKGAYLEPPEVAIQEKSGVDRAYVEGAKRLLSGAKYPAMATHDEAIVTKLRAHIAAEGIPAAHYEWQMLYGIRRDLQERLRAEGENVRVYIPFGAQWYPYFSRRLAERPANLFFIARAALGK